MYVCFVCLSIQVLVYQVGHCDRRGCRLFLYPGWYQSGLLKKLVIQLQPLCICLTGPLFAAAMAFGLIGSFFFIVIQVILLVDLAHRIAEFL